MARLKWRKRWNVGSLEVGDDGVLDEEAPYEVSAEEEDDGDAVEGDPDETTEEDDGEDPGDPDTPGVISDDIDPGSEADVFQTLDGATAWGPITDDNVDAAAGIAESKLGLSFPTHAQAHSIDGADHVFTGDGSLLLSDDGTWVNPAAGSLPTRADATYTTASLADAATEVGTVALGKSYRVQKVAADRACRIRLYTTAAKRTADASREVGDDPGDDAGCLLDIVLTAGLLSLELSPQADGCNGDDPATGDAYLSLTNLSGGSHTVAATFTHLPQEA